MSVPGHHRLLYLIAAVGQGLGAVAVQPFAIRLLSAEQWGQISFSLSLISIGLIALSAGLPMTLSTIFFEPADGAGKARALNALGSIFSIAVAVAAAFLFAAVTGSDDNLPYVMSIIIIGLHGVTQLGLAYLRSDQRAVSFVVITIVATVLGHVAGLVGVLALGASAVVYMSCFGLCVLLATLLAVLTTGPTLRVRYPGLLTQALGMSLPILPHSIALVVMLQGDSVILQSFSGEAVVGRYNAVMPFALGPLAVILALSNVWQTTLLSHRGVDSTGAVRAVQIEAAFVGFILTLGGSGVAVLATYVLVNDPEPVLLALARVLPLLGYGYVMFLMATTQLFAIQKTRAMSIITPLVALGGLAAALIGVPLWSLFTVGVVKVSAYLVLGIVYLFLVHHMDRSLVVIAPLMKGLAASVAVTAVMLMLPNSLSFGIVNAFVACLICLVCVLVYFRRNRKLRGTASSPSSQI